MKTLPEKFVIKNNENHPLWNTYLTWLEEKAGYTISQVHLYLGWGVSGPHEGITAIHAIIDGSTVITLEDWAEATGNVQGGSLPKYFVIKRDENDPRWEQYIDWLKTHAGFSIGGSAFEYYGYDGFFYWKDELSLFKNNPTLITLDQWEATIAPKQNIPEQPLTFPREMWVWNNNIDAAIKDTVLCKLEYPNCKRPYLTACYTDTDGMFYTGCYENASDEHPQQEKIKAEIAQLQKQLEDKLSLLK